MSRVLEFFLGSILITFFTIAFLFFFALHYILRVDGIGSCAWHGSAKTWIDSNGDGLINPGEPPLNDVEVHVDDIQNQLVDVTWPATTDDDGGVQLLASIPGCADTILEIYVGIPEGYRTTTNPRLRIFLDAGAGLGTERIYYFGFEAEQ